MTLSTNEPLVSVLTTSYNREAYIAETIESVLAQTLTNFEFIIVDDNSKDRSFDIAREYGRRDDRIRVFRNESNIGDYPNRNRAASFARGKYLKYVDSDDILYPHALDLCTRYMEQFPFAGLGLSKLHGQDKPLPTFYSPENAYKEHFFSSGLFSNAPGSVIIKREAFVNVGGFSGKRLIGDLEMWLLLACHNPIVTFPGLIHWDRKHNQQESNFDELAYASLRRNVAIQSLESPSCPLTPKDQQRAKDLVRIQSAKIAVNLLLHRCAPAKIFHFLAESKCTVSDIFYAFMTNIPGVRSLNHFKK